LSRLDPVLLHRRFDVSSGPKIDINVVKEKKRKVYQQLENVSRLEPVLLLLLLPLLPLLLMLLSWSVLQLCCCV
jgi:hypothetical protein